MVLPRETLAQQQIAALYVAHGYPIAHIPKEDDVNVTARTIYSWWEGDEGFRELVFTLREELLAATQGQLLANINKAQRLIGKALDDDSLAKSPRAKLAAALLESTLYPVAVQRGLGQPTR